MNKTLSKIILAVAILVLGYATLKDQFSTRVVKTDTYSKDKRSVEIKTYGFGNSTLDTYNIIIYQTETGFATKGFGTKRGEMIDELVEFDWLENDSLFIIKALRKDGEVKTDTISSK